MKNWPEEESKAEKREKKVKKVLAEVKKMLTFAAPLRRKVGSEKEERKNDEGYREVARRIGSTPVLSTTG
ncbi:hypothetical protein [Solitalea lacus]|uniref:hypothetical protein n=1 Tax=Solitalea lacus TaxID=2911172 RepID=UPI001EDB7ACF|nr:hypothetical protein [Solitalea lacus]UKJ08495.1 hypothetical protein L2B55_04835 [Solitalea lacus]UKJ08887.1 hypothetical protein L2B55_06875 [Solitalea lacus]